MRGIGEVIRLTYSATNEISIVPALEIYCAIIGIGLYVLLTLFVDLWYNDNSDTNCIGSMHGNSFFQLKQFQQFS